MIAIKSAEQKRQEVELFEIKREIERAFQQKQNEIIAEHEIVPAMMVTVAERINASEWDFCDVTIYMNVVDKYPKEIRNCAVKKILDILDSLGYKARWYEYTKGWQNQSGKFGYFYVQC